MQMETIHRIGHATQEPVARFRACVPDELERIVRKLLEKSPADRYQSAREAQVDLRTLRRDSESSGLRVKPPMKRRRALWLSAAVLAAVTAALAYLAVSPRRIASVAVLPFENGGANPDSEYLSDGITGSIIVSLSHLPNLTVISRGASARYKGADRPSIGGSRPGRRRRRSRPRAPARRRSDSGRGARRHPRRKPPMERGVRGSSPTSSRSNKSWRRRFRGSFGDGSPPRRSAA